MKTQNNNTIAGIFFNLSIATVLVAAGFFIGSILGATPTSAAGSTVGFVNIEELLDVHPAKDSMIDRLVEYERRELKKLEPYSKDDLTADERRKSLELSIEIRDRIKSKRRDMLEPLYQDILDKSKRVGRESGIEVVLDSVIVLYGGLDLTPAVFNKLDPDL